MVARVPLPTSSRLFLPFEGHRLLHLEFRHECFCTVCSDVIETSHAIGVEYKPEGLGDEIVESGALPDVGKIDASGTRRPVGFDAARAYLAPSGFVVLLATRAFAFLVFRTIGTIEPTKADHG